MFKFILIALLLLFSACSQKRVKPNEKAFEAEDRYILFALRAEEREDYQNASRFFLKLYKNSFKKEYLYRSLRDKIASKEYLDAVKIIDNTTDGSFSDTELVRLKIVALIEADRLKEAKKIAVALAQYTHNAKDYLLASDVCTKKEEYNLALKYLESAYMKEYNEDILDKIAIILYVNLHRKKDAIAELESHARIHGCSKKICRRLIGFYSHDNNIDGLLSVYKRLYAKTKSEDIAQKIVQIYMYKREYVKLMNFLEENHVDDELLLQLYLSGKNWEKASRLALKLYKESNDYRYLGESAIYKYESYGGKVSKKDLCTIVKNLENVIKQNSDALYLNYLGYILIDHEIDVKKGMQYVRKALKKQPNSAYYLDSLAWGYYKLKECEKAKKIMLKVIEIDGKDEPEVKEHLYRINRCLLRKREKESRK